MAKTIANAAARVCRLFSDSLAIIFGSNITRDPFHIRSSTKIEKVFNSGLENKVVRCAVSTNKHYKVSEQHSQLVNTFLFMKYEAGSNITITSSGASALDRPSTLTNKYNSPAPSKY